MNFPTLIRPYPLAGARKQWMLAVFKHNVMRVSVVGQKPDDEFLNLVPDLTFFCLISLG